MFRSITARLDQLLEVLALLVEGVRSLSGAPQGGPEMTALQLRVEELERSVQRQLAEAEAKTVKAESRFAAARSAEERARGMEARANAALEAVQGDDEERDPFEAIAQAYADHDVPAEHGAGGAENGVPGVHSVLDSRRATLAAVRQFKRRG